MSLIKNIVRNKKDKSFYNSLTRLLGFRPKNLTLYKTAFQHMTLNSERLSNERLEFLGDAVLSLIIGDFLFKKYPKRNEGFLTDVRSRLVNREILGIVANKIGVPKLLEYDSDVKQSKFIYGNALEALLGAVYLDKGYKQSYLFITERIYSAIDLEYIVATDTNYKSLIFEWANKNGKIIELKLVEKFGDGEHLFFKTELLIDTIPVSKGEARCKKQSEQNAARLAIDFLISKGEYSQK